MFLFPLYAVVAGLIRAPLGWVGTEVERDHIADRMRRVFNPTPDFLIVPTLFADLGLLSSPGSIPIPTGGLYLAWNHALHPANSLHVHAATGGEAYWYFRVADRVALAPRSLFALQGTFLERSDWKYYGIGPDSRDHDAQDFNWSRTEGSAAVSVGAWEHAMLDLALGARFDHFGNPRIAPLGGQVTPVTDNFSSAFWRARLFLDTRHVGHPNTTGIRVGGSVEYSTDLAVDASRQWVYYDAQASLFWEVLSPGRVLELHGLVAFADTLTAQPVPLVDLVTLGGMETMRGWYVGRFHGESGVVVSATYRYPIWYALDATVFAEAGNVFGHDLAGFDVTHLHGSFGFGFRSTGDRDQSLDVLVGFGSSRFDTPFTFDSVRIAIGINTAP